SEAMTIARQRTALGVPLLRDDEPVGVIVLARRRVEPFTEKQVELAETFADQATIAIENARLIGELRDRGEALQETLQFQTATAEVLHAINGSGGDLAPVFAAISGKAIQLCDAACGGIGLWQGDVFRIVASQYLPPRLAEYADSGPLMPGPRDSFARIAAD